MRIAIYSDNFYPELSGISDSVITLAKELAKRGHEILFCAPRYADKDYAIAGLAPGEPDLGEHIRIARFGSVSYPTPTKQGRAVFPTGLRALRVKKFNPDVIHTQLFFGTGLEALIDAGLLKKPLVGTNHTAFKEFLKYSPVKAPWAVTGILKYINWYYGRCELVTAPSKSVAEEMAAYGFKKEIRIISNPLDTETFRPLPQKEALRKKFGFPEMTVIHAGRLGPERNIDVIVRAVALAKKKIPSLTFALAGHGVANADLRALARDLGIEDSVKFLGVLSKPDLAAAYNASGIFVITSTSDTQSLVMMQAMACGLPVIGVRARALPEYIKPQNGYVVEPGDAETIAARIAELFGDKEKRERLGKGGRELAERFSAPAIATEWEKIYETVRYNYKNARKS